MTLWKITHSCAKQNFHQVQIRINSQLMTREAWQYIFQKAEEYVCTTPVFFLDQSCENFQVILMVDDDYIFSSDCCPTEVKVV